MVSLHSAAPANQTPGRQTDALLCGACGNDRQLVLNSIAALNPPSAVMVEVSYSCNACGKHYVHPAHVATVALVLKRINDPHDVLSFAGRYIHCGQPMQKSSSEIRRLSAASFTDRTMEDSLDVYLAAQVLRCPCGFQMELPE